MRRVTSILAVLGLLSFAAKSQEVKPAASPPAAPKIIGTADAAKHYDEDVVVTGKVARVSIRPSLVFLDLDHAYPNAPFTAVIFAKSTNQFGDLPKLKQQDVEIKGKIKKYNGKPEIVLESTNQLTVLTRKSAAGEADKK